MSHGYDSGRLNLPFVGIATFGKYPYQPDWSAIDADVAILGAPYDFGTQWRAGARFGPRAIREASTLFAFGHAGAYDHEDDVTYLPGSVRIVDIGDADIGKAVNVGAGTITCNYDGANKYKTIIGDGAFIGSGVMLVAPVEIGKKATIGAGSTISKDAPDGQLTLERAKQLTVKGWKAPVKKGD